jgi:hypothetical protein
VKPSQIHRLEAVEAQLPETNELLSAPWELLTEPELLRLRDGLEQGTIAHDEFQRWVDVAYARQAAGFTCHTVRDHFEDPRKWSELYDFRTALSSRSSLGYNDLFDALDVLDLAPSELAALTRLVQRARTIEDLQPAVHLIAKLRCYAFPMTLETFAAMVLHGTMPARSHLSIV